MAETQSTLMPTSTAISSSTTKHVFLHEWWLVNAEGKGGGGGGLAVGGFAHRDTQRVSLFCSAPISKRINSTTVLARDGIAIFLNGLINWRHTTNNGYSMAVCDKFMLGFPYDWDDYANCHTHQSCGAHADVSDNSQRYSCTEKNITYQTTLEDVPVTSIRDMPKRSDLESLMDDILAKVGNPKERDEPREKSAAKRCLKASPVIDGAGYNRDQVHKTNDETGTPSKEEQNVHCHQEEAVYSPNRSGVSRSAKRCLKASLGKDVAGHNHNLRNANVEGETAWSKQQSRGSQLDKSVICHNQMANSARGMNSVHKAYLHKDVAGQVQDRSDDIECEIVTPSKKDQSSRYQLEETVVDSRYQTNISPRSIKSRLRGSMGPVIAKHEHSQSRNADIEVATSSNEGQRRCLQPDNAVKPGSGTGVSTRSMTRLKKLRMQ